MKLHELIPTVLIKEAARGDQVRKILDILKPNSGRFLSQNKPMFISDLAKIPRIKGIDPVFPRNTPAASNAAEFMRELKKETTVIQNPAISGLYSKIRGVQDEIKTLTTSIKYPDGNAMWRLPIDEKMLEIKKTLLADYKDIANANAGIKKGKRIPKPK